MTVLPLDVLVGPLTPEGALAQSLEVATTAQLPVTAWGEGDPSLTLLEVLSYWVAQERAATRTIVAAGWLDYAEDDDALTETAREVYGVTRVEASFAVGAVTVTNGGTDTHVIGANDLVLENSSTGATYRNTSPTVGTVTLAPGASASFDVLSDVAGSASSADPGAIDVVTSGQLGLTVTNQLAVVGRDRETGDALKARCRLKVPAISRTAAGPRGKYAYVAITPEENGGAAVTRADVQGNTATGAVSVVLAGPSGAVSSGDVQKVTDALVETVIGPTETLSVVSATNAVVAITYQLWVYDDLNQTDTELRAAVAARLAALFAVAPIGGWRKAADSTGRVWRNLLEATIKSVTTRAFDVAVTLPASDTALAATEVATLGTITGTITREPAPSTGGTI